MPTILHKHPWALRYTGNSYRYHYRKVNIRKVNKVVDVVIGISIGAFASLFIHVQYMYM